MGDLVVNYQALAHYALDLTVFIEGIPIVFGTRAGLTHPMTDMDGNTLTNMGATAVTSALRFDDVDIGDSELDWDLLMMKPASLSFSIPSSPSWDEYFMRRLDESFEAEATYAGTTITYPYAVTAGAAEGFADADVYLNKMLYTGRESMKVTAVNSGLFQLTVTRAYADFPGAQAVRPPGSKFQWSPTMWPGRRCEIRLWMGGSTHSVVYGVIQASPSFDKEKGQWKFQAKDTMSMLDRKIAVGFTGGDCTAVFRETAVSGVPGVDVFPTTTWVDEIGDDTAEDPGHLMVTDSEGRSAVAPIAQFNGGGTSVTVPAGDLVIDVDVEKIVKARRCYIFKGSPMRAALTVMLSKAGGNSQSVAITDTEQPIGDRLFGQVFDTSTAADQASVYGQEKRFGASIHKLFLDVSSDLDSGDLADAAREHVVGWGYALGLSGDEDLVGFLSEVAHAHNGFWFRNYKGQISFRLLRTDVPGFTPSGMQSFTVTDADLQEGSSWVSLDDESEAIGTQSIECNWHPIDGRFTTTFNMMDLRTHELYRERANVVKYQRRGLYVRVPGQPRLDLPIGFGFTPIHYDMLRTQMERTATYRNGGLRKYNLRLPFKFARIQPGDRVTLTSSNLIDFTGKYSTVSGLKTKVLQVRPDPAQCLVDVEVVEVRVGLVLPPVLEVDSYNAGTKTITLKTGAGLEWDDTDNGAPVAYVDATAGSLGAVFDALYIIDESATPAYDAEEMLLVASITSTTITLTAAPTITPAAGDLIVIKTADTPLPTSDTNLYGQTMDDMGIATWYISETDMIQDAPYYGWSIWIDGADFPVRRWN